MKGTILSIEVNNTGINNHINYVQNNKVVPFKSNSIPSDSIELSTKKKELSTWSKIGIGVGIISIIGLGAELIWGKGKHLKSIWEKISSKKSSKKPNSGEKPKTTGINTLSRIADFKNIEEAKAWFESIGIKTNFVDIGEKHLPMINSINDDIQKLKELGVKCPQPEILNILDFRNTKELENLYRNMKYPLRNYDPYGHAFAVRDNNGKYNIFINSFRYEERPFMHEMGHMNDKIGRNSFWEAIGINGSDFADKELEILGQDLKIYRDSKTNFTTIFNKLNSQYAFPDKDGYSYKLNISKMLEKMQNETGCYDPYEITEQIAYVFDGLANGKQYSDLVMLFYDFAGGARIPNLKIKNMKYDDYIESLYNNKDLIRQLREFIEII